MGDAAGGDTSAHIEALRSRAFCGDIGNACIGQNTPPIISTLTGQLATVCAAKLKDERSLIRALLGGWRIDTSACVKALRCATIACPLWYA